MNYITKIFTFFVLIFIFTTSSALAKISSQESASPDNSSVDRAHGVIIAPENLSLFSAKVSSTVASTDSASNTYILLQDASSSTTAAPAPATPTTPPDNGFFHRLGRAYVSDWAGNGPVTITKEPRRGTPAPIFSPPYPGTDWPIGGTPLIGVPDGQTYPLMQAINENKSKSKIYGWIEIGANGSTNNKTNASKGIPSNFPSAYDEYANTVQLDQAALYFEKIPNTAQKEHFDWGYRLTLLYGVDYRFTTAKGMLSQQLLLKNNQYGFDPVMAYYDFYFPHVGEGMDVRVGRYISLPDIEAQLAPNNYTYSHSILYTFDCYTQTGVNVTVKASSHWTVQGGLSPGCDVMPWTTDAKVTGNFCATFTWSNGGNALNTCANSINDGKYAYNNLAAYYETWYHRINARWHTDTEFWYQYMKATPNMYWYNGIDPATGIQYAPTARTPWPETTFQRPGQGAVNLNFGAVCQDPRLPAAKQSARCYAPDVAITNYLEHNFWHNQASLNIRNEYVDDIKGQRTGTPAKYEEHMVGFDFWAGSTITFRPEVSYTHAYTKYGVTALNISPGASIANLQSVSQGNPPNPLGLGKNQALTLAADLIWHF
ncbi:outer membrane beta-barrel protein [Edaphobacter dinghuensis]|uniref:outer membrane beta-barrel protein n=1 Tax=Edaphobacter dinghuensis TaxID=1560005 RepID=UPI00166A4BBF|nr:outer membrane beta-barrel protein [Edaphobacter dinghuensis]